MKISICDICYYENNKKSEAKYRAGFKYHTRIDLCEEHKNWAKQFKTAAAMDQGILELMMKKGK